MASLNNISLIGRLTRTPESKDSRGTQITQFSVAVDRFSADGEKKADFFPCTAFGKQAEFVKAYLDKGALVYVQGRLEMNIVGEGDSRKTYVDVKVGVIQALSSQEKAAAGYTKPVNKYAEDEDEDPFA